MARRLSQTSTDVHPVKAELMEEAGLVQVGLSQLAIRGKGRKEKEMVTITTATATALEAWLALRPLASPDRVIPAPPVGEAITTAKLAERTGTNRAAWNNWAAADRIGEVKAHPQAGSWRLVGKAPAPGGGPERWLWEPA